MMNSMILLYCRHKQNWLPNDVIIDFLAKVTSMNKSELWNIDKLYFGKLKSQFFAINDNILFVIRIFVKPIN